jgi:hypothetical protein
MVDIAIHHFSFFDLPYPAGLALLLELLTPVVADPPELLDADPVVEPLPELDSDEEEEPDDEDDEPEPLDDVPDPVKTEPLDVDEVLVFDVVPASPAACWN